MTKGINTAKQIVIDELEGLSKKLDNGSEGDLAVMSRHMVLQGKMLVSIYQCEYVTVEECQKIHKVAVRKTTRIKVGPVEFEGKISSAVLINIVPVCFCGILLYALGKSLNWW